MSAATANLHRRLKDINLSKSIALPAAAATAVTASIDLGQVTLGVLADSLEALLEIEATPSLVDSKTITLTIKDSADNSSFTAIPALATLVITGSSGGAAASRRLKLPPTTRRYVRAEAAVETGGGSNIAKTFTLTVLANP